MTRKNLPFSTPDLSALARPLSRELTETPEKPGHFSLMNMVARGAGVPQFPAFPRLCHGGGQAGHPGSRRRHGKGRPGPALLRRGRDYDLRAVFSPGIWWSGFRMNLSGSEVQHLQMNS